MFNFKFFLLIAALIVIIDARSYQSPSRRSRAGRPKIGLRSPVAAASYRSPVVAKFSSQAAPRPVRQVQQSEGEGRPEPYSFTYDTTDEFGTTLTRTESGDANGVVSGSYQYRDATGLVRTVEYADNGDGFSAVVNTNEPGVISHRAADAEYIVS